MKNDKPKTLDSARTALAVADARISALEADLAQKAIEAKTVTQNPSILAKHVSPAATTIQADAVAKSPKRTPEDLNLPETTEEDLEVEIRATSDYKAKWLLQRSLARLQEARAQNEVKARRGQPIGTMAIRRN